MGMASPKSVEQADSLETKAEFIYYSFETEYLFPWKFSVLFLSPLTD